MKGVYKNYYANDKKMKDALLELMSEKKGLINISVCELVKRAGVNRGTFYNHYNSLEEVVESLENSLTSDIASQWDASTIDGHSDYSSFIDALTNGMKANESLYRKIVPSIPNYVFRDLKEKLSKAIRKNEMDGEKQSDVNNAAMLIVSNGAISLFLDYFLGNSSLTLDEIATAAKNVYSSAASQLK